MSEISSTELAGVRRNFSSKQQSRYSTGSGMGGRVKPSVVFFIINSISKPRGKARGTRAVNIQENISLAPHTIYKIGGRARFFVEARSRSEIVDALMWALEKNAPYFILGLGSNILVSDNGFDGLIIKISGGTMERKNDCVIAESGVKMAEAVNFTLSCGLVGFEWAIGVPGTIGGSVRGNAGCFGSDMKDSVEQVEAFDAKKNASRIFSNPECQFGYRESVFKRQPELVVLSAVLRMKPGDVGEARKRIQQYSMARLTSVSDPANREFFNPKGRVSPQDIGTPTAGSIFKNVLWSRPDIDKEKLFSRFPNFKSYEKNPGISAGFLIDEAGLKGTKIGGAMVSTKHANFIVNDGTATASDVARLIAHVKDTVRDKFGISLEEEIQYVGF